MDILTFRRNQVADLKEILHLRKLKNLQVLWLSENPVTKHPNYRLFCIKNLPNLIKLDDKNISREEREIAKNTNNFDGEFFICLYLNKKKRDF